MTIRLNNPDYSTVKGYAEMQDNNLTICSTVWAKEGRVINFDGGYVFCMIADSVSDLKQNDAFKPGTPVCFVAHSKEYEKWSFGKTEVVQPAPLEGLIIEWLEGDGKDWLGKNFKGKLNLNGAESVINAIKAGKVWHILAEFEECGVDLVKEDALKAALKGKWRGGSGGGGGSNKGQTRLEQLNDWQAFAIASSGVNGKECTSLFDLAFGLSTLKRDAPDAYEIYMELLKISKHNL